MAMKVQMLGLFLSKHLDCDDDAVEKEIQSLGKLLLDGTYTEDQLRLAIKIFDDFSPTCPFKDVVEKTVLEYEAALSALEMQGD